MMTTNTPHLSDTSFQKATRYRAVLLISYLLFILVFSLSFWQLRAPESLTHWALCLLYLLPWIAMSFALMPKNRTALLWLTLVALVYLSGASVGLSTQHPAKYWYLFEVFVLITMMSSAMAYLKVTRVSVKKATDIPVS